MKFKNSMQSKLPEIEKAIELIAHLKASDEDTIQTNFPLNDGIYCSAEAKKNDVGKNIIFLYLLLNFFNFIWIIVF